VLVMERVSEVYRGENVKSRVRHQGYGRGRGGEMDVEKGPWRH